MRTLTYAGALNEALKQEMRRDPNIYVAGEDVGVYGGIFGVTAGLLEEFGEKRVKDTPITESAIIGSAVGAAATGLRPVVEDFRFFAAVGGKGRLSAGRAGCLGEFIGLQLLFPHFSLLGNVDSGDDDRFIGVGEIQGDGKVAPRRLVAS